MKTPEKKAVDFLRNLSLFSDLPEKELQQLCEMVRHRVVPKYATVYEAGDASDEVFFLFRGTIKIANEAGEGREVIKHILHPLAIFGELGLVGEQARQNTARALDSEVHLFTISTRYFQALMQANHQLAMNVLNLIGERLRHTEARLEAMIFKDARGRIIDFLRESAHKQGKKIGFEMLIKHSLTQQDIANITGTSRQTVTSVLNDLRKDNLIYFNRRSILIRDLAKLV